MSDISNTAVIAAPANAPGQGTSRPGTAAETAPDGEEFATALRSELRPGAAGSDDPAVGNPSDEVAESAEADGTEVGGGPAICAEPPPAAELGAGQGAVAGLAAGEAAGTPPAVESSGRLTESGAAMPSPTAEIPHGQGHGPPTAGAALPTEWVDPRLGGTDGKPLAGAAEGSPPATSGGPEPEMGAAAGERTAGYVQLAETGAADALGGASLAVRPGERSASKDKAGGISPAAATADGQAGNRAGEATAAKATAEGVPPTEEAGGPITVEVLGPDGPTGREGRADREATTPLSDQGSVGSVADQLGKAEGGVASLQIPGDHPATGRLDSPAAEASPAGSQNAAPAADQIISRARAFATPGVKTVEVQLQPAELGRVVLRVSQGGDGQLAAVIAAENAETATALRAKLDDLLSGLARQGLELSRVEITTGPVARGGADGPALDQGGADGTAQGFGQLLDGGGRGGRGNGPAGEGSGAAWLSDSRSIADARGESSPTARAVTRSGYARRLDLVA